MTMNTFMSVSFEFSFNSFDTFLCSAAPFRLNWLVFVFVTFNEALQLKAFSVLQTTNQTHYMHHQNFFFKVKHFPIFHFQVNLVIFIILLRVIFTKISKKYQTDNVEKTR